MWSNGRLDVMARRSGPLGPALSAAHAVVIKSFEWHGVPREAAEPALESRPSHHYSHASEVIKHPSAPLTKGVRAMSHEKPALDEKIRTELEAAAFRRLVEHLRARTDVQNIDLMNLAGFCRNCLSNWMKDAADARGVPMSKEESRETIYGMPYDEWRAKHQKEATKDQQAAFQKAAHKH
jgi:uncharacterized protein